jgi:hypothetical protein
MDCSISLYVCVFLICGYCYLLIRVRKMRKQLQDHSEKIDVLVIERNQKRYEEMRLYDY